MQHRNALLTTLRATRLNPTLHSVNRPYLEAAGALGQTFLEKDDHRHAVAAGPLRPS